MSNNDNMIKLVRLFEGTQFAGEPEQKAGDQVRGTDKAVTKGRQHPFHNRLVGEEISLEDKLSKRYQDMKDVQAKEKEQKKKEELDEQGVSEGSDHSLKKVWDRYSKHLMAGRGYHTDVRQIHKSGEILQNIRKYVKDHHGQKAVDDMERYAEKQKWNESVAESSGYDGSEPLDLSTNPSVNDVFKRALYIYDYEGYGNDGDYSEDEAIEQYVARKFGQDVLDKLTTAKNQQYFGRADGKGPGGGGRTSNLGTSSAPGGNFRTTKAGVMNKQDAKMMKAQVANRLGRHPAPNLPEQDMSEDAVADFLARGGQVQQGKFYKPRKSERTDYGSRHIGGVRDAVAGKAGKTLGRAAATNFKGGGKAVVGEEFGGEDSPVSQAITRRILLQRTDLLSKYGPVKVMAAIDEVADFVGDVEEIGSSDVSGWIRHVEQMLGNMEEGVAEATNPTDKITVDVPLMIRIMEYAREEAQDDVDLHNVAEQLVRLSGMGKTLGMDDYDGIVGMTTEQKLSELGAVPPTPPQGTANAAPTSGSVSPDEQTALNKIQTNPAMKQQFDKLMTQATPGAANKPAVLDPEQADALEKIKTNAGLKGQYDRLIKQANPTATP